MSLTRYGGGVDDYVQIGGVPVGLLDGLVWEDEAETVAVTTGLQDLAGNPISAVKSDTAGYFEFDSSTHSGDLYLDFGAGPKRVSPANLAGRIATLQSAFDSLSAAVAGLSGGAAAFVDTGAWAASHGYVAGNVFLAPDGSIRYVNTAYSSASSYGSADTTNTIAFGPATTAFLTASTGAGLFAPISLAFGGATTYVGDTLSDGYDPDPNGYEVDGSYTLTSLLGQMDDVAIGGVTQVMTYRFRPSGSGSGYLPVGLTTIPDSKVSPAAPLSLGVTNPTVGITSGSPVVTWAGITTALQGQPVTGTGIPAKTYVGTVVAATSFRLSSSPTTQVDVNATANGTSCAIAPTVPVIEHDLIVNYLINAVDPSTSTFPGSGLKIRVKAGSATFVVPTAPGTPTSFVLASSTTTSATFTWTIGTSSGETEIWKNKRDGNGWKRVARLFNQTTWTDTDVASGVAADYMLLGRVPGAVSAFTSTLTVSPSAVFSLLPQTGSLPAVPDPTFYTVTRGTNTASALSAAGISTSASDQLFAVLGGHDPANPGVTNAAQDRVILKLVKDTTQRRSWGKRGLLTPNNSSAILEIYLGTDDFTLTAGSNNFLRFSILPNGSSCEGKAALYNPAGEGDTTGGKTTGSFQRFTDTAYATNIVTGVTRTAGGVIPGNNMTPGTYYGLKVIADIISGGRQLVSIYWGSEAQYGTDGSGLPLLYTVNLTANFVTARPAGYGYLQELGKQTSPTADEGWTWKNHHEWLPIAA